MNHVRDVLRVAYWGVSLLMVVVWIIALAFIALGVMGSYDLTFLSILSFVLLAMGIAGLYGDVLNFLWDRD